MNRELELTNYYILLEKSMKYDVEVISRLMDIREKEEDKSGIDQQIKAFKKSLQEKEYSMALITEALFDERSGKNVK